MFLLGALPCKAQSAFSAYEQLFTPPRQYLTFYTNEAPEIDGNIEASVWQQAAWSEVFTDIEGDLKAAPTYSTRMKILWDDHYLYIAAELEEPHVWARLTEHDDVIYHDNDFEVFIDPENTTHQYYEIEVNALNTLFDLFLPKPYRNNGRAMIHWNLHDFRSAIQVQGTLNDPGDKDKGWTIEMAIPFRSISMGNEPKIPEEGSLWRINFSRVQWEMDIKKGKYVKSKDEKGKPLPEKNWVWSPQGLVNMHYPERWGYLHFTRQTSLQGSPVPELPYAEKQKRYLWLIYYKQQAYHRTHDRYAVSFDQLGINEWNNIRSQHKVVSKGYPCAEASFLLENQTNKITMEAGTYQFKAIIQGDDQLNWSINQEGLIELTGK
ncbi:carbohydrate-binding family 9-like protein [Anditalea andensis]|uniref:carbohydrate-binding family 9-like protein n=1 Tax=Anditalea andensis TaxID=1048983 RepID=UPI00068C9F1D|nr:carbohydrate-binding family 9-like protein [Anditalea andensis]